MAEIAADQLISVIDVGTTKICVLIGQRSEGGLIDIIGIGKAPSHGLKRGVVVDVAKTVQSIKAALKEAELMANISVQSVGVGISGAHISSTNSLGAVPIKNGAISSYDIHNALAAAKAIPIPEGQQILHVLPQSYVIDGRERVQEPIGMHGIRLEVQAHVILGAISSVQNLIKCCQLAGVTVNDIVLEQLASADAVLSIDEKELGVGLLDIGGGTSDFAVYKNGSIWHTRVVPVAGNHFTQDIAIGLRTTLDDAERIKMTYGIAMYDPNTMIDVEMIQRAQKRQVPLNQLHAIVESRARELLFFVQEEIERRYLRDVMRTGLVLTGGGALLIGFDLLAERLLNMPVRIGIPQPQGELSKGLQTPQYATGYGLLVYVARQQAITIENFDGPLMHRVFKRMRSWMSEIF